MFLLKKVTCFCFITICLMTAAQAQAENLVPYRKGSLWGFCTADKKIVVQPAYQSVMPFYKGMAIVSVSKTDGLKYGTIDEAGNVLIPLLYDDIKVVDSDLTPVKKAQKWGLVTKNGKEIVSFDLDEILQSSEGIIVVSKGGKVGGIDSKGKNIIAFDYDDLKPFKNGFAAFKRNAHWGFLNNKGKEITAPKYDKSSVFSEGLAVIEQFGKRGFVTSDGKEVVACAYDRADACSEGLCGVLKGNKWGFLDKNGIVKIDFKFDNKVSGSFVNGLSPAAEGLKWGYINTAGGWAIPPQYEMAQSFFGSNINLARTTLKGKVGLIDRAGQWVVQPTYSEIEWCNDGLLCVKKDGKYGFLNVDGKEVVPCKYTAAAPFSNGLAKVSLDAAQTKACYIDSKGTEYCED